MERRQEVMDVLRDKSSFPREIIDRICEYDLPFRDVVEDLQNRLEHFVHSMDHFHRHVYRYTKFVNPAVQREVEHWFRLEESHQVVFRRFLERFRGGFKERLQKTGFDAVRDPLPLLEALDYIHYFRYELEMFQPIAHTTMVQ